MGLFSELKRRNVIRVGIAYVLSAWVLLQAADFALDLLDVPNWMIQALFVLAIISLPGILIFSWVFEITPEGIRREHEVDRSESITRQTGHKLDRVIIGVLVLAVGYLMVDKLVLREGPTPGSEPLAQQERTLTTNEDVGVSVAVLPFVNISADKENEYFSDGLTETLLHMLAQLPDLQVAARTSSFAFKGQNKNVAEIAATLGVAHILEGSVQKANNQVRITAQLVRANDGFHVWSQNYTRPLEDIFAIQDEIATDVANAMGVSLLGTDAHEIEGVHTANLTAYENWLKGLEEQARFSYASLPIAENHFKQALARDPGFTDARLSLVRNYLLAFSTGLIDEEEMLLAVNPLLARVREEDPESPLARALELTTELSGAGRSKIGTEGLREIIDELRDLLRAVPTETLIRRHVANFLNLFFRQFDEAEEVLQAGLLIDPLAHDLHATLGDVYMESNRLEEARVAFERSLELEPGNPNTYHDLHDLEKKLNNLPKALDWAHKAIEVDPQDHELAGQMARDMYWFELPEEGDRWNARVQALAPGSGLARSVEVIRADARKEFDRAIALSEAIIRDGIEDRHGSFAFPLFTYGRLMAEAGKAREAYDFITGVRPGISNYEQLAEGFEGVLMQWVSILLMSDFESFETRQAAWNKLVAQMDAHSLPWRSSSDAGPTIDLLMNGDIEGATEAFLAGPLSQPLANNLGPHRRFMKPISSELYSDPRVAARLAERDREFEVMRKEVQAMLLQPEWDQ